MATTMVAWGMAVEAWDVAMVAMDIPLTIHAGMEDFGLLVSSKKF